MISPDERKWFVYMGDHHEGPFTVMEIRTKVDQNEVSSEQYVWCEGMGDWQVMTDVPGFLESQAAAPVPPPPQPAMQVQPQPTPQPEPQPQAEAVAQPAVTLEEQPSQAAIQEDASQIMLATPEEVSTQVTLEQPSEQEVYDPMESPGASAPMGVAMDPDEASGLIEPAQPAMAAVAEPFDEAPPPEFEGGVSSDFTDGDLDPEGGGSNWTKLLKVILVLLILGGTLFAFFMSGLPHKLLKGGGAVSSFLSKVPVVGSLLSPLSSFEHLSESDLKDLEGALGSSEPSVALGVHKKDPLRPTLVVSSSLGSGAQFEAYIVGVPHTLLNSFEYRRKVVLTLEGGAGESETLDGKKGTPLPMGEYRIFVMESKKQPQDVAQKLASAKPTTKSLPSYLPKGRRLVLARTYFLGGEKDMQYSRRLKEYHDRLKSTTKGELTELRQFSMTLDGMFKDTVTTFRRTRYGVRNQGTKSRWKKHHQSFEAMVGQLKERFRGQTLDDLRSQYFFGRIYGATKDVTERLLELHDLQNKFVDAKKRGSSFDIEWGEAKSQVEVGIATLKSKIKKVESQSTSGNIWKDGV